jgi:hypothetical protein
MVEPFQAAVLELCSFRTTKNPLCKRIPPRLEHEFPSPLSLLSSGLEHWWESNSKDKQRRFMAGVKGRSGPPGNQNNFKHGLSLLAHHRRDPRSEVMKPKVIETIKQRVRSDSKTCDLRKSDQTLVVGSLFVLNGDSNLVDLVACPLTYLGPRVRRPGIQ